MIAIEWLLVDDWAILRVNDSKMNVFYSVKLAELLFADRLRWRREAVLVWLNHSDGLGSLSRTVLVGLVVWSSSLGA